MPAGRRALRLNEEMREEITQMVTGELKDPRIGLVTVTRVALAGDLRSARVFVSVAGDLADRKRSLEGLRKAAGFVRRELGQRLRLRYAPELTFTYDAGQEHSERVARLLEEVHADEASREPEDEA
jgi:ribosome-binding factor A